jgi:hypothetical protein
MGDRNVYPLNQAGRGSEAGSRKVLGVRAATLLATDVALNRTVGLCIAPAGFVVTGVAFVISDVDTNGAPTHAFSIGIVGTPALITAIATTGQAGGTLTTLAAVGLYFKFTADIEIIMTTTTGSATAVAGTATFQLEGYME